MSDNGKHISLPTPFSSSDPVEWFRRFEIFCHTNDWEDKTKAKMLSMLLEGEAIAVWFDLATKEQKVYSIVKAKIMEQMVPARFIT